MHHIERLMIRLPPHWISFPIQPNRSMSISVCYAVDKVDIHQLGVRITIHFHRQPSLRTVPPIASRFMARRKQRSAFDQVSDIDTGSIVAYRYCGLSFREIGSRIGRN
ncbi:hypothetical protein TNCV_4951811 [Trichonephila clavipes]|nr:hypothetical protein TNCV_4951811 [Trichonephila clavipes]